MFLFPKNNFQVFRALFVYFAAVIFLLLVPNGHAGAASSPSENEPSTYFDELLEKLKKGTPSKFGTHYYWDKGFHVVSPNKKFVLKVGGLMGVDLGYVDAHGDLKQAFSSLDSFSPDFRRLIISTHTTLYNAVDIKLEIDFANVRTVKDIWIRYKKSRFLSHFRYGNMKEPYSLERLTSSSCITFMERALPVNALSLGRNIGIQFNNTVFDDRFTFGAGVFWNTGSLHDISDPQDSISEANGYNITARVTGLGWYEDKGQDLMHWGLACSWGSRNGNDKSNRVSALPESRLLDQTLVDTEEFAADSISRINSEFALVSGPLSFQSELTYYNADAGEHLDFWGYYLYASYFFTGEHRAYDRLNGVFLPVHPGHNFNLRDKKWGAWEIGFRHSYVDLNDEAIKGGKERNFTFGLNWYINPNMRVMFNFIRAEVEDRDNSRVIDDGSANILQMRFQIHY